MSSSKRRTRISRGQSKVGCFTCRARKIKCDETKPSCLKCQQGKFACEGYPSAAFRDQESTDSGHSSHGHEDSPVGAGLLYLGLDDNVGVVQPGLRKTQLSAPQRFISTGLNLLLNSYGDEHVIGQDTLKRLIVDHAKSSTAVSTACAALGAAAELQQHESRPENLKFAFEEYYGQAMSLVKQDIGRSDYDRNAILAACAVLGSVENVLWRRRDALKHLRGAYQVFYLSQLSRQPTTDGISPPEMYYISTGNVTDADVDLLLRIFDISTMKFMSYTHAPIVPPTSLQTLESFTPVSAVKSVGRLVVHILHATAALINKATVAAVESCFADGVEREHNRCVSLLHQTITFLTTRLEGVLGGSEHIHLLILRNLCLAAIVEIQGIFAESEAAWDEYAESFQQIIVSAETVFQSLVAWRARMHRSSVTDYTAQVSILQPLYLAALKYRNKEWRRRAIATLRLVRREGPWIGKMMAAIADRVTDLEELSAVPPTTTAKANNLEMKLANAVGQQQNDELGPISEHLRIAHIGVQDENGDVDGVPWPLSNSGRTTITLLRRRRPASVLAALPFTSTRFGVAETGTAQTGTRQLDVGDWEKWDECIEFGPDMRYRVLEQSGIILQATIAHQ